MLVAFSALNISQAQALEDYGFYMGIEATASWWQLDIDNQFNDTYEKSDIRYDDSDWSYSALGRLGGYLNWGEDDIWFTAIEFFGEPNSISFEHQDDDKTKLPVNQATEATYSLGGQLKQGVFVMDDLLAFMTAGLVYTQFKVITNYENGFAFVTEYNKFYLPGFRFGAGAEWFVTENIGIDVQAAYTWYEEENLSIDSQIFQPPSITPIGTSDFNPSALQLGLGFNFYFN